MSETYSIFIKIRADISAKQFADLIQKFFNDYIDICYNTIDYNDDWVYLEGEYDSGDEKEIFDFLEKSEICELDKDMMMDLVDGWLE